MALYESLSELQLSIISEIGNIGAGNAATALSSILADKVGMSVPDLRVMGVEQVVDILGGPEKEVVGILVYMEEDVEGMLLFLLGKEFVCMLINVLLGEDVENFEDISEMGLSALLEMGNILSGAYSSAIAEMTGMRISLSPPQIAVDMVGAILSYPAAVFGTMGDSLMLIEEDFFSRNDTIKSHLLIMPEAKSLEKILERLEI